MSDRRWCTRVGRLLLVFWVAGAGAIGSAQEVTETAQKADEVPSEPLPEDDRPKLELTLEEAVQVAMEQNLGLKVQSLGRRIERTRIAEAQGEFEPVLFSTISDGRSRVPTNSQLQGAQRLELNTTHIDFGARQVLPTGGSVTLTVNGDRQRTNSQFATLNPNVSSFFQIEARQPLLRGAWTRYGLSSIDQARLGARAVDADFERQKSEIVFSCIEAYWRLVFSIEDVEVKALSLRLAQDLYEINQAKVDEGVLAPVEVLDAESQVFSRREQLISAQNAVKDAEDILRRILFNFELPEHWDFHLVPGSSPSEDAVELPAWQMAAKVSRAQRADLQALRERLEQRRLTVFQATNELGPQLDLFGSGRSNGVDRTFRESFSETSEINTTAWQVGLSFELPFPFNRTRSARLRRARLELRQAEIDLYDRESSVVAEVRASLREIATLRQQIVASRKATELAQARLEAEQKKYDVGFSTNFQVLELQERLANELTRNRQIVVNYQIALRRLENAQGTLLTSFGLDGAEIRPASEDDGEESWWHVPSTEVGAPLPNGPAVRPQ
ncbi:MAG: TolC family protein [Planctomycetota bacterium]